MPESAFVLTLASAPLPGIIAAVTTAIADLGGNITETHQHWDRPTDRFFLRVAFLGPDGLTVPAVEQALALAPRLHDQALRAHVSGSHAFQRTLVHGWRDEDAETCRLSLDVMRRTGESAPTGPRRGP